MKTWEQLEEKQDSWFPGLLVYQHPVGPRPAAVPQSLRASDIWSPSQPQIQANKRLLQLAVCHMQEIKNRHVRPKLDFYADRVIKHFTGVVTGNGLMVSASCRTLGTSLDRTDVVLLPGVDTPPSHPSSVTREKTLEAHLSWWPSGGHNPSTGHQWRTTLFKVLAPNCNVVII